MQRKTVRREVRTPAEAQLRLRARALAMAAQAATMGAGNGKGLLERQIAWAREYRDTEERKRRQLEAEKNSPTMATLSPYIPAPPGRATIDAGGPDPELVDPDHTPVPMNYPVHSTDYDPEAVAVMGGLPAGTVITYGSDSP